LGVRDWWSSLTEQRKSLYLVLVALILLTLPCYALGFIALQMIQTGADQSTPAPALPTAVSSPPATRIAATPSAVPSVTAAVSAGPSHTSVPTATPTTTLTPTPGPAQTAKPEPLALPTSTPATQ